VNPHSLAYSAERPVTPEQYRDVLVRSTLAERRPVDDPGCLRDMLENASLTVTCWDGGLLVGIARSVTDFCFCCYLSDLAVDRAYQRSGIGKKLIQVTRERLGPRCKIILLAAPAAESYYQHIGFKRHPSAWLDA
jgi:GNAT superfamily N-acetyltransferase